MEEIIDIIKCLTDVDDVIEYLSLEKVNILSVIKYAKEKEEDKSLISLLLKASSKIKEVNKANTGSYSELSINESIQTNEPKDDIERVFDYTSITPEQFELFRRTAWQSNYYFDDFNFQLGEMH
jgi:hypothetical protein